MKTITVIAYLLFVLPIAAESNESILLKLSVACQNAQEKFVDSDAAVDPSLLTGYLKTINITLDRLVDSGYLVETNYVLKKPAKFTEKELDDLFNALADAAQKLYEEYGYYTGKEMVDDGFERRNGMMKKGNDTFSLRIRVPKKYMKDIDEKIQPYLKKKHKKQ